MAQAGGRPCYYLVGATGFPNYGDELIALGWLRFLARTAPEADVWLDCHTPGSARVLLDGVHPRLRCVDTLWRLCWQAPSDEPWAVSRWVRHAVAQPELAPRWAAGIEQLARADVVHLIGGGYINGLWPRHVGLLAGAAAAVQHFGARAALTGHGLVPAAEHAAPLVRALTDRFDVVDVRDAASVDLLQRPDTHGVDDAFLGLDDDPPPSRHDAPCCMLCLQSDLLAASPAALASLVSATLRSWHAPRDDVGIVEALPGGDREVVGLLEHELPGARVYRFGELWNDGLPAAPHQTWISTRFHPHLLAAATGASGIALTINTDYYPTKHRSLTELGSRWAVTDDPTGTARPSGGGFDRGVVARCARFKQTVAATIYTRPIA